MGLRPSGRSSHDAALCTFCFDYGQPYHRCLADGVAQEQREGPAFIGMRQGRITVAYRCTDSDDSPSFAQS